MIDRLKNLGGGDLGGQVEGLKESALDMTATAREKLSQGGEFVRSFTVREPTKALGIALGMGVLLGWLIKRR
jgi:ElaB/YqjD/DUF883 family membrane-anchored ribosome-binding protein